MQCFVTVHALTDGRTYGQMLVGKTALHTCSAVKSFARGHVVSLTPWFRASEVYGTECGFVQQCMLFKDSFKCSFLCLLQVNILMLLWGALAHSVCVGDLQTALLWFCSLYRICCEIFAAWNTEHLLWTLLIILVTFTSLTILLMNVTILQIVKVHLCITMTTSCLVTISSFDNALKEKICVICN